MANFGLEPPPQNAKYLYDLLGINVKIDQNIEQNEKITKIFLIFLENGQNSLRKIWRGSNFGEIFWVRAPPPHTETPDTPLVP